jgi:hypothetical protein
VLIVENDPAKVEVDLVEGRAACPACGGVLARWSFARRRFVRTESGPTELRPRRARCRKCAKTQVLLPDVLLCRRVDTVAVVGRALTGAAGGGELPAGSGARRPALDNSARLAAARPGGGGPASRAFHSVGATGMG